MFIMIVLFITRRKQIIRNDDQIELIQNMEDPERENEQVHQESVEEEHRQRNNEARQETNEIRSDARPTPRITRSKLGRQNPSFIVA